MHVTRIDMQDTYNYVHLYKYACIYICVNEYVLSFGKANAARSGAGTPQDAASGPGRYCPGKWFRSRST